MSGAGQDDSAASFIGALISLTSKSNMRYQGVLSNIDAAQATLALEKGRWFWLTQCDRGAPRAAVRLQASRRTKFLEMIRCTIILSFARPTSSTCASTTLRRARPSRSRR